MTARIVNPLHSSGIMKIEGKIFDPVSKGGSINT